MKVLNIIRKAERYFVAIGLLIMMVVTSYAVFNRFVLKQPLKWSDELVRYIFIWVSFIGTSIGVEENAHVGISVFADKLPKKINKNVRIIASGLSLFFCVVIIASGILLTIAQHDQLAATLRVSMSWLYISVPVGFGLTALAFLENIIKIIKEKELVDEAEKNVVSKNAEVTNNAC